MTQSNNFQKIYREIGIAVNNNAIPFGETELLEESTTETIVINHTPSDGIHADIPYKLTLKLQADGSAPRIFIDSVIFDKIKTNQYNKNRGTNGDHKGICIKKFGYAYGFKKNFKLHCDNKWENYLITILMVFKNIQDFEGGNGFKSNYKEILSI